MKKLKYDPLHLKNPDLEWGLHKKCKEWWYATGVVFDEEKNMYTFQYTLVNIVAGVIPIKLCMIAMTDYKSGTHHYLQQLAGRSQKMIVTDKEASMGSIASAVKGSSGIHINLHHKDFQVDVDCDYGKGAIWHCDNGKLQMGISGRDETTYYYSYTNMPTSGTIVINGKPVKVSGKTWFDKQGGTYSITDNHTNWEWFSLRFFDAEEVMLFTFPQNEIPYFDGTYIRKDGTYEQMNTYTIEPTATVTYSGAKWSSGWKLHMPIKDQDYTIEPVQDGHMNFVYFEELCYIKNSKGEVVGYSFAELMPGVRNLYKEGDSGSLMGLQVLFKRVEI